MTAINPPGVRLRALIKEMSLSARITTDNTLMAILNVRELEKGQDLIISISAGPLLPDAVVTPGRNSSAPEAVKSSQETPPLVAGLPM